jgi:hypothetical protein
VKIEDDKHNINETGNEHMHIHVDDSNKTYLDLHVKCSTFLLDLNQIWTFLTDIHKSPQTSNFTELWPVADEMICADRHIGKLIAIFGDKANTLKIGLHNLLTIKSQHYEICRYIILTLLVRNIT